MMGNEEMAFVSGCSVPLSGSERLLKIGFEPLFILAGCPACPPQSSEHTSCFSFCSSSDLPLSCSVARNLLGEHVGVLSLLLVGFLAVAFLDNPEITQT